MAKVAVKFFRDSAEAALAAQELKSQGYSPQEIGILARDEGAGWWIEAPRVLLAQDGWSVVAVGPLAAALEAGGDWATTLAQIWGIPEEEARYYEQGVSLGGVVVSVHSDEARLAQARHILRGAEGRPQRSRLWGNTPGFVAAHRMTETNPMDAKLSGDFRKY